MTMRSLSILALALAFLFLPTTARAQLLLLDVGEADIVQLSAPAEAVFVANPQIADVQVAGPQTIIVFGVATGATRLFALDEAGRTLASRQVRVQHNLGELQATIRQRFPGNTVRLSSAPRSLFVEGVVTTPEEAKAIRATLRGSLGEGEELIDRLTVDMPTQVNLRVRIAEVSRTVDRTFGIDLSALFGLGDVQIQLFSRIADGILRGTVDGPTGNNNYSVDAVLQALDEQGLARTLAEPNLTALSGETATFLAGGEFPIPVAQDGDTITIEFRSFGISLAFTPTVLSRDRINLLVRPEVSAIDPSDNTAIELGNDIRIPALTVRRAETSVEIGSGQSLAIGGLLQQSTRDAVSKFPGLGDVPILGTLFTSTEYQNEETELIIIVTPYIVRSAAPAAFETPLGQAAPASAIEQLLLDRTGPAFTPTTRPQRRLTGPAGFIY